MKENLTQNQDLSTTSEGLLKETHINESQQIEQEPWQLFEFQTNEHTVDAKLADEENLVNAADSENTQVEYKGPPTDAIDPVLIPLKEQFNKPVLDTQTEKAGEPQILDEGKKEEHAQECMSKEISLVADNDGHDETESENLVSEGDHIENKDVKIDQCNQDEGDEHKEELKDELREELKEKQKVEQQEEQPNDDNDEMKNRSKNDINPNSIKAFEELLVVKSVCDDNQVNHDSHIKFNENWDKCKNEAKLNSKEFIAQIGESLDSSILPKIEIVTQVAESLLFEINKNNEKIDNNVAILNKNNEILYDNSNSLSSLSSSIKAIQNLISELPQTEAIKDQFSNIDSTLAVSLLA